MLSFYFAGRGGTAQVYVLLVVLPSQILVLVLSVDCSTREVACHTYENVPVWHENFWTTPQEVTCLRHHVWVLVEPLPCGIALSVRPRRSLRLGRDRRMRSQVPPTQRSVVCLGGVMLRENYERAGTALEKRKADLHMAIGDPGPEFPHGHVHRPLL